MVLSNVWLNPLVSMTDEAGMRNRCKTFNGLLQGVGINQLLDDEMIEGYIYCAILNDNDVLLLPPKYLTLNA